MSNTASIELSSIEAMNGVSDGIWTHDRRGHNPVLYQLSYTHHILIVDCRFWILDIRLRIISKYALWFQEQKPGIDGIQLLI